MRFDDIIDRLAKKNKKFRDELQRYNTYSEISNLITAARLHKGFSQEELAKLIKTKQPSIARLESGKELPSVSFLDRIAKALHTLLIIRFDFMEDSGTSTHITHYSNRASNDKGGDGVPYQLGSKSSDNAGITWNQRAQRV